MSKIVLANLGAPPVNPAPGTVAMYSLGNVIYSIDSSGTITSLGGGGGGVTISAVANQGIAVTGSPGGPAFTMALSVTPQAAGSIIFRNGADTQWVGLGIGTVGQVLTVAGGVPTWVTPGGGGSVVVDAPLAGDGTGGNHVRIAPAGEANGDLLRRAAGVWGSLPIGTVNQVLTVIGGVPTWQTPAGGAPVTDIYIAGVTGNDANDGLSVGTPVRTINRVMQIVPTVIHTFCTVHCALENITETVLTNWELPYCAGSGAKALTFDAPVTNVLASTPMTGGTQGSGNLFGTITHALLFVATPGQILVYETAGPNQGMYRICVGAPGAIQISGSFPAAPVATDTFRVVTEGVTINLAPSTPGVTPSIRNGSLLLSGVKLNFANNNTVMFDNVELFLNVATLTGTPSLPSQILSLSSRFYGMISPFVVFGDLSPANVVPVTTVGIQPYCGPWLDTFMFLGNRSSLLFFGGVLSRIIQGTESSVTLARFLYTGLAAVSMAENSRLNLSESLYFSGTNSPVVAVANGSTGRVSEFSFNGATGLALTVANNSYVEALGLIGTVGATNAVTVRNHSRMIVADANAGSNVVGSNPAFAVIVGGNGGTTWANIATNTAAFCLDNAALLPTFSAVTTS